MSRYELSPTMHSQYFMFFFFLSFIPLAFSQLPIIQQTTMTKLSKLVTSWSNSKNPNPCSWKGVNCTTDNTSITHLSLAGFDLSNSTFLTEICQVDTLQSLDLSNNSFSSIPTEFVTNCGKINGLRSLNISRNQVSGPLPVFQGFVKLESLDLAVNDLSGSVDLQLDGLVGLKSLNLSSNNFTRSLPTKLGRSLVLEELQLSKNGFTGAIPENLFRYKNLTLIDLSVNHLSGSVSNAIGEISKLKTLILSTNNLTGEIPSSLSQIRTLLRLSANQNKISGTIPSGISQYLRTLDLSFNKLEGLIPNDLLSPSNLEYVDLSVNSLSGNIPSKFSSSMFRLRLGSNSLNGTIPMFGMLQKLTYLELDNNRLSGEIPVDLGSCKSLALLNLAQNNLTGSLPKELGNLQQLQVLKLQNNQLTGEIPNQFLQLVNLAQFNVSRNSLKGTIPFEISKLSNLINLDLHDNQLTGSIPATIGNLSSLLELQLGKNLLGGRIPAMPPRLQIALNLSNNHFEGRIPDTLNLPSLEVLDLSNNAFSGEVPGFLTTMNSLTLLLLSNNQLSGVLPSFTKYVIVEKTGNKDLRNASTPGGPPGAGHASPRKKYPAIVPIVVAVVSAIVAVGIVWVVVLVVSRRYYRVNDVSFPEEEHHSPTRVINGHMITTNSIHRSGIDFTAAMQAVCDPANIFLKTRFSTYYNAVMPSGANYYVKKLNWGDKIFQLGNHESFGQELEVLGRLNNSNIMNPLAYVLTVDSAYVFYEYAEKGTLFDAIHGDLGNALDWESRYSVAVGIVQGLAFLHGYTNGPILLLDLSTKSILLKSLKEPKIGDIELYKVIDPSKSTGSLSTIAGSVGYNPPEYAYTMRVTMAGNIYSLGVILLELLTGKPAVSEGTELVKWVSSNSVQRDKVDQVLDRSVSKSSHGVRSQMQSVLKIALSCVSVSPDARPKTRDVLRMLINAR